MLFKNFFGVIDNYGYDGAAGLLGDLEASLMEFAKRLVGLVSGSLGIDEDGNTVFDLIDGCKDHLKALSDVASVKEEAVHVDHPYIKKRNLENLLLGDEACGTGNSWVAQHDIKDTSVIPNLENRLVLGNVLFADNGLLNTA